MAPSDVYLLRKSFFQYGRNDWELLETPLLSDAINICRHLQIHLVLLALNLSNSCELNRLKKFHFSFPRLPIIVLTTLSAHQLAQQTLAQGAQDYLFKEHTREGWFWRAVERTLEHSQILQQIEDKEQRLRELQQKLEQHQQTEAKYRSIFENARMGIFLASGQGSFLDANTALARILGYDSPQQLLEQLVTLQHQLYVDPQQYRQLLQLLEQSGAVDNFESQVYRQDGEVIWISQNVSVVSNRVGQILSWQGTIEDITARKQTNEELFYRAA